MRLRLDQSVVAAEEHNAMHELRLCHLRYFVAAAGYGSFRRASAALGIQESTVSRSLRYLEDRLGAALFHRQSGGVALTVAGTQFLQRARDALQLIECGAKDVLDIRRCRSGRVSVGIFSSLASGFLAELFRAYLREHADILIDLSDGDPTEHVAAVRRLELDVAFITGSRACADCETEVLWSEQVFAVLPQHHALANKVKLEWHDVEREEFIVSEMAPGPEILNYLVQRLADLGHHPRVHLCKLGRHNLLSLVGLGHGLTLTSEATTASTIPGIVFRPIGREVLPFSAVWSARNDNPALRRLLSLARKMSNAAGS